MTAAEKPGGPLPGAYVVARVQEALGTDSRVGELGLVVTEVGAELVIRGPVTTEGRKAAVLVVAREALDALGDGRRVRDETTVPRLDAVADEEELA